LQLAIGVVAFSGHVAAEFFSLRYRARRTYFTAQTTRQKKWAEEKSAHLFHASAILQDPPQDPEDSPGVDIESAVSSTSAKLVL